MLGVQLLAQLFQRLIVDGLYTRNKHVFEPTQFQRYMVALDTRRIFPEMTSS